MVKSKDEPICPYCKSTNRKSLVLGTTGLISYNGVTVGAECSSCKKSFVADVELTITYKTRKT